MRYFIGIKWFTHVGPQDGKNKEDVKRSCICLKFQNIFLERGLITILTSRRKLSQNQQFLALHWLTH